jgi:hypothetical protein
MSQAQATIPLPDLVKLYVDESMHSGNWLNQSTISNVAPSTRTVNTTTVTSTTNRTARNRRRRQNQRLKQQIARQLGVAPQDLNVTTDQGQNQQGQNSLANRIIQTVKDKVCPSKEWRQPKREEEEKVDRCCKPVYNYCDSTKYDRYFKAICFPERRSGARIPNAMSIPSAVGQYHYTYTVTPSAAGLAYVLFRPMNINASDSFINVYASNAGMSVNGITDTAAAVSFIGAPPLNNDANMEAVRIVSAGMTCMCINANSNDAAGTVALCYQPNKWTGVAPALSRNISQRDIEDAAMVNGTMGTYMEKTRCIWMPRQPSAADFSNTGSPAIDNSFCAAVIAGSNVDTRFRFDFYVNYEYIPGENLEEVVDLETADMGDETAYRNVISDIGPINPSEIGEVKAKPAVVEKVVYQPPTTSFSPWDELGRNVRPEAGKQFYDEFSKFMGWANPAQRDFSIAQVQSYDPLSQKYYSKY